MGNDSATGNRTGRSNGGEPTPTASATPAPAEFAEFSIAGPSEVQFGEPVSLTVSAKNVGGRVGSYEGTLGVVEGSVEVSKPVEFSGVAPGDRGEATVEFTPGRADDVVLGVNDAEVTHELSILPATASVGEALDLQESLRATLAEVSYEHSLHYGPNEKSREATTAPEGSVLAVLRFELENVGTESVQFPAASLAPGGGELYENVDGRGLGTVGGIEGDHVFDASLKPGVTESGWLLARLPRSDAREGFAVGYQRDARETRPEFEWRIEGTDALPSASLVEWTLPERAQQGTTSYRVTVENDGSVETTVRGAIRRRRAGNEEYRTVETPEATLSPGERRSFEYELTWRYTSDWEYALQPFGRERTLDVRPWSGTWGESSRVRDVTVTVNEPTFAEEVVQLDQYGGVYERHTPENGQFLLAPVRHQASGPVYNDPKAGEYHAEVGGEQFDGFGFGYGKMGEPIEAQAGVVFGEEPGYVIFDVPAEATLGDVTVVFSDDYTEGTTEMRWSSDG